MEITEVRIKLVGEKQDKLKAFCSITFDDSFVIRDLKIIEGSKGLFVAMPSRKLTFRCDRCGNKNPVRSNYCADCGRVKPLFPVPSDLKFDLACLGTVPFDPELAALCDRGGSLADSPGSFSWQPVQRIAEEVCRRASECAPYSEERR